jgi:PTH1 family peptidyl-tRNA hydrolase
MKYLIAGLGNIGDEYVMTRHNVGFTITETLAQLSGISFQPGRYASTAVVKVKNRTLLLIRPATFMNLSGKAVRYWLETENIPVENLLVVTDDIALPPGQVRLRMKGGDGGHNGLTSIIEHLKTEDFARLRFGIGNEFPKGYQSDYVLGKWTEAEIEMLRERIPFAIEKIREFVLQANH